MINIGSTVDITGERFGRLIALKRVGTSKNRHSIWLCKCDCGSINEFDISTLRYGKVVSCGCYAKEYNSQKMKESNINFIHGATTDHKKQRLYRIWSGMKNRCLNKNNPKYPDYGGRGITVCKEWSDSFLTFQKWALLSGYDDSLSIDRIDNDCGYSPKNCRWATKAEQGNNKRNTIYIECNGEKHTISEWSTITGIPKSRIYDRLKRGDKPEQVLSI